MSKLQTKAAGVVAEWKALSGGCLKPGTSDVPLQLLEGYIKRALEDERKRCAALVKAALEAGGDRDFDWGHKLLKSVRSGALKT